MVPLLLLGLVLGIFNAGLRVGEYKHQREKEEMLVSGPGLKLCPGESYGGFTATSGEITVHSIKQAK